jgi:NAD(P)-dependent dehydrogenase (short-subunit alcohol dehydrogenase family)
MVAKHYKKNILISGASGFLGQNYTRYLLSKSHRVIAIDINIKKLKIFKNDKNFSCYKVDITSKSQLQKLYLKLKKKNFFINVLINNAAIDSIPNNKSSKEIEVSQLKKEINVSIVGAYLLINFFSRDMILKKSGKIINIGSDLSIVAPNQKLYHGLYKNFTKPVSYSLIKHAMAGATKYYASLFGDYGICVNMLSPGPVFNNHNKKFINRLKKIIPLNRMAEPKDLFAALDFLIDDKNNYFTGQNLIIDGGRTII